MSKWYVPYDDEEKVRTLVSIWKDRMSYECVESQLRLRGEVHRVVAARDQKYQSNFVEVSEHRDPFSPIPIVFLLSVQELQDCIPSICWPLLLHVC